MIENLHLENDDDLLALHVVAEMAGDADHRVLSQLVVQDQIVGLKDQDLKVKSRITKLS